MVAAATAFYNIFLLIIINCLVIYLLGLARPSRATAVSPVCMFLVS